MQAKIPMVMPCDQTAIKTVIKTCGAADIAQVRLLRIPNTLQLEYLYASEAMLPELRERDGLTVVGDLQEMTFSQGRLTNPWPDAQV
jgi:hypothetical protein